MPVTLQLPSPYALFLGDGDQLAVKTATGIAHWRPERCLAQVKLPNCSADLGLPTLSPKAAYEAGARLAGWDTAAFTSSACPTPDELQELQATAAGYLGRPLERPVSQ